MNTDLETIDCPLCGSKNHEKLLATFDRFDLNGGLNFEIVSCLACHFRFLNPRPKPNTIAKFYESNEYQPFLSTQTKLSLTDRIYRFVRTTAIVGKRASIEKLKAKGKILDIGCGTGEFLNEMQKHGWQVEGIEKDAEAASFAKRNFDLTVNTADLEKCDFPERSFDVITMWHVLEHLFQPGESLKKMQSILKDEGIILIAVPNISSFDARFYKSNWVALDSPRHLSHFAPESMKAFCKAAKLTIWKFSQMPLDAFYNCLLSEALILKRNPLKKAILPFYVLRPWIIALFSLILSSRLRATKNRLGSSILYFIQKRRESS